MTWVTSIAAFFLTWLGALYSASQGYGYWPAFLTLACLVCAASLAMGRLRDAGAAALIGVGILAMLAPFSQPYWSLYAAAWWLPVSMIVGIVFEQKWAARFLWLMPIGYAGLLAFPGEDSIWAIVEISGVIALICLGMGLHETIMHAGRWLGSVLGIASRGRAVRRAWGDGNVGLADHRRAPVGKTPLQSEAAQG